MRKTAAAILCLMFTLGASSDANAQDYVRVSVKHILNSNGARSTGAYTSDGAIENVFVDCNRVLANHNMPWRLLLDEIVDVPDSTFFSLTGTQLYAAMEPEAKANPAYSWRDAAINVYVVGQLDAGGYCSYPGHDIIVINNGFGGILNGSVGWLHEFGHYLSLTHTFSGVFAAV